MRTFGISELPSEKWLTMVLSQELKKQVGNN